MKYLVAMALFLSVVGCTGKSRIAPLAGDAMILCFGDSLTYGTGSEPGKSYPDELARLLGRPVANGGIPGETSGEALKRLPGELERVQPRLLILCSGANDILRHLDLNQAAVNLREMVLLAKGRGIDVVLIAVPRWGLGLSPARFYGEVAAECGVPVEETILKKVLGRRELKSDEVHPNAAGYRKIAEAVAALITRSGGL